MINYLEFWRDVIRGLPAPPTSIPVAQLDRRMPYLRVDDGHRARPTGTHAAPGAGGGGGGAGAGAGRGRPPRVVANEVKFENTWHEFTTLDDARTYGSRIHEPKRDGDFYTCSLTGSPKKCRYDEIVAMQGGRKTAHMPTDMAVGNHRDRLYVCYRNINDSNTAVFFVRRLKRIRAD